MGALDGVSNAPGQMPQASASNDQEGGAFYAMLAAAGGVGLGAAFLMGRAIGRKG